MNTYSFTGSFASNNEIIYIYIYICHVLNISTINQLCWQNVSNVKKNLILNIFQIAEGELNEITSKK